MQRVHSLNTLWVETFDEIALSRTVKEIEANLCFAIVGKIRKFKMAAFLGEGKIFLKLQRLHSLDTLWVENFDKIALSRTVKEIEANLCFAVFGKNSKVQKGRHFWGGEYFFENCQEYIDLIPCCLIISTKSLSRTVKATEANLCFAIFGKNSKIQNGRHFSGGEIFLKIAESAFLR